MQLALLLISEIAEGLEETFDVIHRDPAFRVRLRWLGALFGGREDELAAIDPKAPFGSAHLNRVALDATDTDGPPDTTDVAIGAR